MRQNITIALAAALAFASAATAKKHDTPLDPGPAPTSEQQFHQIGEAAVLRNFFDPGSAQVQWDLGIASGYWKPPLRAKVPGWFTCGQVNGRNRMGGYVGFRRFVIVQRDGQAVFVAISNGSNFDLVDISCEKAIKSGLLVASTAGAGTGGQVALPLDPNAPRLGIGLKAVPRGIQIGMVETGSVADKGGLKVGMVISHVNGVAIAGFNEDTVKKMLHGIAGEIVLTILGQGEVKVTIPRNEVSA